MTVGDVGFVLCLVQIQYTMKKNNNLFKVLDRKFR